MSSRCSSSSGAKGGTLALRAASSVAASMSACSSLRVSSTMKPSPIRVGIFASTGVPSLAVRALRGPVAPERESSRRKGGRGRGVATPRPRPPVVRWSPAQAPGGR